MSRASDRHDPPAKAMAARPGVPWEQVLKAANYSMPQKFLAIFCRAGSAHPAEHSCKVLLGFEAAGHRDVQDTRLARAQHFPRTLHPMTQYKVMRAFAG